MIAQVTGTLVSKELDRVEIMTAGGVAYDLAIPLGVYETLPRVGEPATLHTFLVVKEDAWQLFGFSSTFERRVFQRVLNAKGVGPALALGLLSRPDRSSQLWRGPGPSARPAGWLAD